MDYEETERFLAEVSHPDHCTGRFGVALRCIYPSSRWQTQIDHFTCGTTLFIPTEQLREYNEWQTRAEQ